MSTVSPTTPVRQTSSAPRDLLTLDELGPEGLRALLNLTRQIKRKPAAFRNRLKGGNVGMIFDRPSTRTRVSFEAAAWFLGMLPIALRPDELQLGHGETIEDTARALSLYLNALTVRTAHQSTVEALAAAASIPVVNALTDDHHPCQALADLVTLEEETGSLTGLRLAFVGDGDNVCHSLIQAAGLAGFELCIATPVGFEPSPTILAGARERCAATGGVISLTNDPNEAVAGADAVYADVWVSMGKDSERGLRQVAFKGYTVNSALMARAAPGAIFLHCLPAHRGEEVTNEVMDGPSSRVWQQAANRLHTETALLYTLLTRVEPGNRLT